MPYLNLDLDYFEHPKVKRLVALLGKGSEVLPIRLWCYCGKYHSEDGRLAGYSAQEIESITAWWGKQGEMIDAMVRVGLIENVGGEYVVHDWTEHEGHLSAFKIRAKAAAKARWGKISSGETAPKESAPAPNDATSNAYGNATSMLQAYDKQCPIPTMPSNPNQPVPAVASNEALPVHVQQLIDPQQLPPPHIEDAPLKIPPEQFSVLDGSTLRPYLLHAWGRDARKVSYKIETDLITLGKRFGWKALYRAIDEAATHGAMTFAYVESIVDPEKASERKKRNNAVETNKFLQMTGGQ